MEWDFRFRLPIHHLAALELSHLALTGNQPVTIHCILTNMLSSVRTRYPISSYVRINANFYETNHVI